jgi:hypothetical protein
LNSFLAEQKIGSVEYVVCGEDQSIGKVTLMDADNTLRVSWYSSKCTEEAYWLLVEEIGQALLGQWLPPLYSVWRHGAPESGTLSCRAPTKTCVRRDSPR